MNNPRQVYLAFYKGRKEVTSIKTALFRFTDWLTRASTKGKYSHVEIAVDCGNGEFECYSSSSRDGGVRCKQMDISNGNWTLIPVDAHHLLIQGYFAETQHQKYDLLGAIASTIPFVQLKERQFCSEWCFNALAWSNEGWRFSPNDLFAMAKNLTTKR